MTDTPDGTRSVILERDLPHPPEKVWRALTQPHLIEEWLMKNAFTPTVGHRFELQADWGKVECEVLSVEPNTSVSYTWGDDHLRSVVTWSLSPIALGADRLPQGPAALFPGRSDGMAAISRRA